MQVEARRPATPGENRGVASNARLTASVGMVLFVVLGLEGLTILSIRRLLGPHAFIGFMLGNSHFWLTVHKGSFILWFFVTAIHVLGYLKRAPSLMLDDLRDRPPVRGAWSRRGLVLGSLGLGLAIAVVAVMVWATTFQFPLEQ